MCPFRKKQSKEIIEFSGDNSVLLQVIDGAKYYNSDAIVVVPMTHVALIIQNGALREKISGGSAPLFSNTKKGLFGKKRDDETRSLKIVYISKTARLTVLWGTNVNQRITYTEPVSSLDVSVGAFGSMDIRIRNAEKFYLELVAADNDYSVQKLQERIRNMTVNETLRSVKQTLMITRPAYKELNYAKDGIQDKIAHQLNEKYVDEFGFEVTNFIIENLNIDSESMNELKARNIEDSNFDRDEIIYERKIEAERRRKRDKVEDLDMDNTLYKAELNRQREKEEYERKNRHEDEDRAWARDDKSAESEERKNAMYFDTVKQAGWESKGSEKDKNGTAGTHHCTVCGAAYKPGAKYCPDCGATLPSEDIQTKCPHCGTQVPWGTAYCPICGEKIENRR